MAERQSLELAWYGQSMFRISGGGITVVCDPTPPETGYRYDPVKGDAVLVSHGHFDHGYLDGVQGSPEVIESVGKFTVGGIEITGIDSFHDANGGKERGLNIIFAWEQGGFRLAHFGDLGISPPAEFLRELEGLDIAMVPVGGIFTIDGSQAAELVRELSPAIAIPMHYKTPECVIPVETAGAFAASFPGAVREITERPLVIEKESVPASTEVWIVPYQ